MPPQAELTSDGNVVESATKLEEAHEHCGREPMKCDALSRFFVGSIPLEGENPDLITGGPPDFGNAELLVNGHSWNGAMGDIHFNGRRLKAVLLHVGRLVFDHPQRVQSRE